MSNHSVNMCEGPLTKKMIVYTIPIMLTGILQSLFNTIDLIVVGRFCGTSSVAAVGASSSLIALIIALFLGLSVGTGVSTAQGIGAGNREKVQKIVHTALPLAIIGGLLIGVIGVFGSESFLRLQNTPEQVLPKATLYMKLHFCGIVFQLIYNFCAAILRAVGDTRGPLVILVLSGIVKVILNLITVAVIGMDVEGLAISTILSHFVSALLVVYALMKRDDLCHLSLSKLMLHGKSVARILRIGLPSGIQESVFGLASVLMQSSINSFGEDAIAGTAAAGNIESIIYIATNAFHLTTLNFVAQNAGVGNYDRIKKILRMNLGFVAIASVVLGWSSYFFGESLLGIYISDSQEAIRMGMIRLCFICLPYLFQGMMDVIAGGIIGLGRSSHAMTVSIFGICGFRILWIFTLFAMFPCLEVLFAAFPASWILTMTIHFVVFSMIVRKEIRKKEAESNLCEMGIDS